MLISQQGAKCWCAFAVEYIQAGKVWQPRKDTRLCSRNVTPKSHTCNCVSGAKSTCVAPELFNTHKRNERSEVQVAIARTSAVVSAKEGAASSEQRIDSSESASAVTAARLLLSQHISTSSSCRCADAARRPGDRQAHVCCACSWRFRCMDVRPENPMRK
jgi:hypothetical protein